MIKFLLYLTLIFAAVTVLLFWPYLVAAGLVYFAYRLYRRRYRRRPLPR
jgi:hypothetical protein